jgi:hypothetical protein
MSDRPIFWRALAKKGSGVLHVATDVVERAGHTFVSLVNLDTSVVHMVRPEEFWQDFEVAQVKPDTNAAAAFWSGVYTPQGMSAEAVKAELADYHFLLQQVPLVYQHVTGGLLSKTNYFASAVMAAADDETTRLAEQEINERVEPLRALLRKAVLQLGWLNTQRTVPNQATDELIDAIVKGLADAALPEGPKA